MNGGTAMFLLSLLGLGAIIAAEKIHDTHNCNTYQYKDDYKGWVMNNHRMEIRAIRERDGEEAVKDYLRRLGVKD